MDTPLKNQSTPLVSKFQDSPVSNFIGNLSPIEPVKFIRSDHTFNSPTFASSPSGFTPPHIVSPFGNKFLQKRHHFSEASKPEISGSCNVNSTCDGDSNVSQQLECSLTAGSLELAVQLPCTLKLSCGSPESNAVPFDATKADGVPESIGQYDIHQPKGGHSLFEREAHLRRICRAGFDWEMSISDADDLLNFDSQTIEESSVEEDPQAGDPGVMSFVSNFLVDNHNDEETRHTADPIDSSEQFALKKFCNSETEYLETVDGGVVPFISDILEEIHNGKDLVEYIGPIDSSDQCESEKFSASQTVWESEIEQAPEISSRPLLELNINRSDTVDANRRKCTPPSCKLSAQSHTIRRRCLVFEKAETQKLKLVCDSRGTYSVSLKSNCEAPTVVKESIQTTLGIGGAFSSARLPGIGLHLNALATLCDTNLTVETLASENPVMNMPDSKTGYTTVTLGEDSCDKSSILNYLEDDLCKNGAHLAEGTLQMCKHTSKESEHSSPKRKRFKRKHVGDSGRACKHCNCRRSKCLKLYCECFAAGLYCTGPCSCNNCSNKSIHAEIVHETRRLIELRNPLAFAPRVVGSTKAVSQLGTDNLPIQEEIDYTSTSVRHKRGCNCKKSSCLKRYCECFQGGAGCSLQCKCVGCRNSFGQKGGERLSDLGAEETQVEDESGVQEKIDPTILTEICRSPPDQLLITDLTGTSKQNFQNSSLSSSPRLGRHLQTIPEDETFKALDRSTSQPGSVCVKIASQNSKRVSPPRNLTILGRFGSLTSQKGGRKFTLRSVLPFTNL